MSQKKNKTYPIEFKKEAVRLALESGKPKTVIAKELGVGVSLLYAWINQQAARETMSKDQKQTEAQKIKDLEAENKKLKSENALLKKAAAYFAKNQM
ncbi:transposase [Endozoicomonas sp. SM1973]|uniref:Transposase n=1 Tax=Spartinivicinus marinus TaxID=2994442 RepID=A0A853I665_9GAMM|nr:transposase [Spartinivicinus marinus]MCX4030252.1 transposase [Spartinivicinus marinus]NYZ69410.1 transposase [Spartinivicinus marinus]